MELSTITLDASVLRVCLDKCMEDQEMTWGMQIEGDHHELTIKADGCGNVVLTVFGPVEN